MKRSYLPLAIAGFFALALLAGLAVMVWRSQPLPPSPEHLAAAYARGVQYERGDGVTMDYGQALAAYREAAEGGYPPAEFAVGLMTDAGHGVLRDPKAALDWFRRAAEHGVAEAQVRLAGELISGAAMTEGKPDRIEALKWLLLGAEAMPDPLSREVARATREKLALEMSAEDRAEAAHRADGWRKQHPATQ